MSRSAVARPQLMDDLATTTRIRAGAAVVAPADGFARVGPPGPSAAVPTTTGHPVHTGRAPSLRNYLTELFVEGGGTIVTAAGRTLVQADGDLVTTLADTSAPDRVDEWSAHVQEVATWFSGLRHRMTLVTRRLGVVRLVTLGVLPLVIAVPSAAPGPASGSVVASAVGSTAALIALVTVAETSLSLLKAYSAGASVGGPSALWGRIRHSRPYGVVLSLAPAVLAAWSALLHERPVAAFLAVLGPGLAVAGIFALRLWVRHLI